MNDTQRWSPVQKGFAGFELGSLGFWTTFPPPSSRGCVVNISVETFNWTSWNLTWPTETEKQQRWQLWLPQTIFKLLNSRYFSRQEHSRKPFKVSLGKDSWLPATRSCPSCAAHVMNRFRHHQHKSKTIPRHFLSLHVKKYDTDIVTYKRLIKFNSSRNSWFLKIFLLHKFYLATL